MIEERPESPIQEDQNPVLFIPQIDMHLTGGKVQSILDNTLQKCYVPLIHFHWFRKKLSELFELFEQNPRTKLSKRSRSDFVTDMYNLINTEDQETFIFKVKDCGIDRNLIAGIVTQFLTKIQPFVDCDYTFNYQTIINQKPYHEVNDKIYEIEKEFDGVPLAKLLEIYKQLSYWYGVYIQFKQMVAAKFYRLAYKYAKHECATRPNLEIDCLFQNLLMVLNLAIDKYDSEKGALASHIQVWIKGYILNESCSFELGQAFQVYSWNLKTLDREHRSSQCISTDSDEYIEKKRQEEEDGISTGDESGEDIAKCNFALKGLDVNLLKTLNNIQSSDIDVVKLVLGIPKITNL